MAESTTEIDLDSVIDRLLEGTLFSHPHPGAIPHPFPLLPILRPRPSHSPWIASRTANVPSPLFLLVRGNRPGKPVQLQEYEINYLCTKAREIFINQPILLELEAPIKICGPFSLQPRSRPCTYPPLQVTSMANITTSYVYSSMEVFHRKQTTSFSVTT